MSDSGVDESDGHVSNNSNDSDPVPRHGRRSSVSEAAEDGANQTDEGEDDDGGGRIVHTNTKPPTVHYSRPVRTATLVAATMKKVLIATSIVLVGLRGEEQVRKRGVGYVADQGRKGAMGGGGKEARGQGGKGGFKERVPLASLR